MSWVHSGAWCRCIESDSCLTFLFFFSSRRRHTRCLSDWSSDVCSSDLIIFELAVAGPELLDRGLRGQRTIEIFFVYGRVLRTFRNVVEVDRRRNDLVKVHLRFFQVVEQVAHGLPGLFGRRSRENSDGRAR